MRYPGFVPTINLQLPVLSLTLFAHCYPSQTLLWLKIYQKLFSTHMHNWLLLYICRKNTYQSAVIRSISQCLAPKFASLSQPQKPEAGIIMTSPCLPCRAGGQRVGVWSWSRQEELASEAAIVRPHRGRDVSCRLACLQRRGERVARPHMSRLGPQPTGVCASTERACRSCRRRLYQRTHGQ